jgi:carbamoyltransferase
VEPFHSELLEKRLGPALAPRATQGEREQNIAASLQRVTEEIIFHCLNRLHERVKSDNVVLVGGCAMNSVANGKVTLQTPFKNVFVPAGAADNGTCFGAAFDVWYRVLGNSRERRQVPGARSQVPGSGFRGPEAGSPPDTRHPTPGTSSSPPNTQLITHNSQLVTPFQLKHSFWGPSHSIEECRAAAAKYPVKVEELKDEELFARVVDAMCEGKVVGWFQGRAEFGARALGCRSLIADPRRADMRDIINLKIKFREKFRPFAPSILAEHVGEWFEIDAPSPFMEKVFQVREVKRAILPAITHVDGSGRLQSVTRDTNPRYYNLIEAFRQKTGVPVVLNTSLNENEPIVNTPEQAIDCFLRTKMDHIVLENLLLTRMEK